jgi:hypothetical protein
MRRLGQFAVITSLIAAINCGSTTSPGGSGSSSGSGQGSSFTQTFAANIGNAPWTANGRITATYSPAQNNVGTSVLNIVGQDFPLTQTFGFAVAPQTVGVPLTTGIYQVAATTQSNALLTVSTGTLTTFQATGSTGSGTITITTFNTLTRRASGSFNFVVVQSGGSAQKAVAGGTFDVTF